MHKGREALKTARAEARQPNRTYVLVMLLLIYTSNFIDRTIVGIIGQPMKEDLGIADWQLGLLGGLAFALFYSTLGLPIARIAERRNRVWIISLALLVWSGFTASCGLVQNFTQLMLARIGVGVGEAGCAPASQSLIADLYPPEKRAMAMSVFSLGIPLGVMLGAVVGGLIAARLGWRAAFLVVGLPGVLLALVTAATIKDPDPQRSTRTGDLGDIPRFGAVLTLMWKERALRHLLAGAALAAVGGYSISSFAVPFLLRSFGLTLTAASVGFGLFSGAAATIGTLLGGWLVTRRVGKDPRAGAYIPALGLAVAAPLYVAVFATRDLRLLALAAIVPATVQYFYLGPTYALINNLVEPRMRATAVAILLLTMNAIGLGLGPLVTGALSDLFATLRYGGPFQADCFGALATQSLACRTATSEGLRLALCLTSVPLAWGGLHYWISSRSLRR